MCNAIWSLFNIIIVILTEGFLKQKYSLQLWCSGECICPVERWWLWCGDEKGERPSRPGSWGRSSKRESKWGHVGGLCCLHQIMRTRRRPAFYYYLIEEAFTVIKLLGLWTHLRLYKLCIRYWNFITWPFNGYGPECKPSIFKDLLFFFSPLEKQLQRGNNSHIAAFREN